MVKTKKIGSIAIIGLICSFLFSGIISANPVMPSWNSGLPAVPDHISQDPNSQDLVFSSEYVYIEVRDIGSMKAWLDASYIISNSGDKWINQTIAIPGYSFHIQLEESDNTSIKIDGIEVDWIFDKIYIPDDQYNYTTNPYGTYEYNCFFINMSFSPYQVRNISVEFPVSLMNHRSADTIKGTLNLIYVVTTGAQWSEPIGDAVIIISIPEENIEEFVIISPELPIFNNESQNTIMIWEYHNWTPTQEIVVSWNPDNWPAYATVNQSYFNVEVKDSISFEIDAQFNGSANDTLYNYFGECIYKIDYGDGTISNWSRNSTIEHTYASPGNYTIMVWVSDWNSQIECDEPLILFVNVNDDSVNDGSNNSLFIPSLLVVITFSIIIGLFTLKKFFAESK